jgi:hypothetical protein
MKRSAIVVCIAVLFLSIAVWAANKQVDFSGTWQRDVSHSDAAPKSIGSMIGAMTQGGGMGRSGGAGGGLTGGAIMNPSSGLQGYKTLVIKQATDEIQITNKGADKGKDLVETIETDGKERTELVDDDSAGPMVKVRQVIQKIKAQLTKDKLTITTTKPDQYGGSITTKREFTLSKDLKTMTLKINTTWKIAANRSVYTTQKLVFSNQPRLEAVALACPAQRGKPSHHSGSGSVSESVSSF